MSTVNHDDVVRLFPGIQDHTVVEVLATEATLDQLEAASLLFANQDEGLIDAKREASGKLSQILDILGNAEIQPLNDRDR